MCNFKSFNTIRYFKSFHFLLLNQPTFIYVIGINIDSTCEC